MKVLDATLEALDMSAAVNNRLNVKPATIGAIAVDNGASWGETAQGAANTLLHGTGASTPTFSKLVAADIGAVTGTGGGIIRDVLCGEMPALLRPGELYVTTCIAGGLAGLARA